MADTVRVFVEAFRSLAGRFPSPLIEEADGVASCFGNVPLFFFNLWAQTRPAKSPDELRALLRTGVARASACRHPTGGVFREDWLPVNWENILQEKGLAPMMTLTGMEADQLLSPRRPPANLDIRRVTDDTMARDVAAVNAEAYGLPLEAFECMAHAGFWRADDHACVGYVDGKAVCSAAAVPAAGTVYVAFVATLPEAQGKGYAETVMRHAVTEGQKALGTTLTTLHATDMGQPIYQAMGYKVAARFILAGVVR